MSPEHNGARLNGASVGAVTGGVPDANNHHHRSGWQPVPQHDTSEQPAAAVTTVISATSVPCNNNGTLVGNGKQPPLQCNGNGNGHRIEDNENSALTGSNPVNPALQLCDDSEIQCGVGSCRPRWARPLASTRVFMVVFLLAWILQGMYYTYFVSVITTIEKLFQIKSKTTGMLMSATEVGQISTALFLTYYAGRGHRPRWIACGMVLFAISSFGCTLPHFIYGDRLLQATVNSLPVPGVEDRTVCRPLNATSGMSSLLQQPRCDASEVLVEQAAHSQVTQSVLTMLFISLLGVGVGQTAVSTLGIPYIDDNVASRESPLYIAITIGVRILGPASGFMLGSLCTRVYADLTVDPHMDPSDPRWIGAWWLGLLLVSSLMALTSLAMFCFPKTLKGNRIPPPLNMRAIEAQKKLQKQDNEYKRPQLKDFPATLKRLLSNDILMFRTASSVLHLLPVAGLYTFLPKYLESQFRFAAPDANMIIATGGILVMGVGIVISGIVILKFNPTARSVAAWIAFTAIVYAIGMTILMFVGCPMDDFAGLAPMNEPPLPKFNAACNTSCACDRGKFSPVCGSDGRTYFSACHAGCHKVNKTGGRSEYSDCECILGATPLDRLLEEPPNMGVGEESTAISGYCNNCENFPLFITLFIFFVFIHSTSEVGSMLLIMRCTDPKDKAMAMGVIQFAIGLFGNVPCPIIYGAVVDSACLVWETVCGVQGACWLYDVNVFRHFFLGTTGMIMLLAFVMDIVVWHKADRIDIDPENSRTTVKSPVADPILELPPNLNQTLRCDN